MLSGETANGSFPIEAVKMMAKIVTEAENTIDYQKLYDKLVENSPILYKTHELLAAS